MTDAPRTAESVTTVRPPTPPFSMSRVCPKCGGEGRLAFHNGHVYLSEYGCAAVAHLNTSFPGEHLCVTCQTCHFRWYMATKDASLTNDDSAVKRAEARREMHPLAEGQMRFFVDLVGDGAGIAFLLSENPRLERWLFKALRNRGYEPVAYGHYSGDGAGVSYLPHFDGSRAGGES